MQGSHLKGTQVLVTGGAGFIGSHLVDRLVALGSRVRVIDDLSTGKAENLAQVADEVEMLHGSILDSDLLSLAFKGVETVFHLAAVVSVSRTVEDPIGTDRVNGSGTLMVLDAAVKNRAKVVFSSSAAVYGDGPEPVKREDLEPRPLSPYGVQKLTGERYLACFAALHGLKGHSLRYFNVYGPRQDPANPYSGVISIFANHASAGRPLTIFGDGNQTRDFIYVGDVVEANLAAAVSDDGSGCPVNIATGSTMNLNELAEVIKKISGSASPVEHEQERAGDIRYSRADVARARERLGFVSRVSMQNGLERTLANLGNEPERE